MSTRHFATVAEMVRTLKPGYPVYCIRPAELQRRAALFLEGFPGRVLYAVKCNPHLEIIRTLYKAGIRHFDTASLAEIALIREHFPNADCYFMHPVKSRAALRTASSVYGVDHFVIDHHKELEKMVSVLGGGDGRVVMVRFATPHYDAAYRLSEKFGAGIDDAVTLLRRVDQEGYQAGLAFHVGSQCRQPSAYRSAIELAGDIARRAGVAIHYLDIGGGFPVPYVDDEPPPLGVFFETAVAAARRAGLRGDCVLMCEPGRAMVASAMTLVVQVQLRKEDQLYVNDGVYQSLNETAAGVIRLPARLLRAPPGGAAAVKEFRLFGPTCDSLDVLPHPFRLPVDVEEGDWIEIGQIGAYSNANASHFNGFFPETYVTVDEPPLLPDDRH